MIALLQRVARASVRIDGRPVAGIGAGVLAFVCAERADGPSETDRLLDKVLALRLFPDADGRMNRSVRDVGGGLLVVPQFTLAADTRSGTRPSFTPAAEPEHARRLFTRFVEQARRNHPYVASGEFGAMMQVELVNDGPVTFWLQVDTRR
jgi:D-tyrosyl-tRNA(Tyr) deacylase